VSRAFIKEDNQTLELEKAGEFRALWGLSRSQIEPDIKFSSDDLNAVIKWARLRIGGFYLLVDAVGTILGEVD
jgi:hypothetical protein